MRFNGAYEPMTLDYSRRPWLVPKPCCGAVDCKNPTALYAAGWRCEEHEPRIPDDIGFVMITGLLFDGSEFKR